MLKIPRRTLLLASPWPLTRAQAQAAPDLVRFSPEIEPLVRQIESVEREKCAEWLAAQMQRGTPYRHLLAAVFLAGVRNVNPRPPGFALHCVFLAHAAHQLSMEAPPDVRALPLFFVLDDFKAAQARDAGQKTGDYSMRALSGGIVSPHQASVEFAAAMDAWDSERAERAAAALARFSGPTEAFENFWRYGARDYRNIGHKAIFVANANRTLQTIGWQHGEPVLRSVALALLDFGREQSMNGFALNDQCFAGNEKRVRDTFARLPAEWTGAANGTAETRGLLKTIRTASVDEACAETSARLAKGSLRAGAVWEAVHLSAAELRMRASGANTFAGVHAVTAANGLHAAYLAAADPRLRFLLLLQGVGWMGQFRQFAEAKPEHLQRLAIDELEPAAGGTGPAIEETLAAIPAKPATAAALILRLADRPDTRRTYLNSVLRHSITKADEVHFYKYLVSLLETLPLVSAAWQPHLLAATAYYAKGAGDPEPAWAQRTREALRTVKI